MSPIGPFRPSAATQQHVRSRWRRPTCQEHCSTDAVDPHETSPRCQETPWFHTSFLSRIVIQIDVRDTHWTDALNLNNRLLISCPDEMRVVRWKRENRTW